MTAIEKPDALTRREFLKFGGLFSAASIKAPVAATKDQAVHSPPRPLRYPPDEILQRVVPPPLLPEIGIIALNRLGFGLRPGDLEAFRSLGSTSQQQLTAYVDQQLNPGAISDSLCDTRLGAEGFVTLNKPLTQLWNDHVNNDPSWDYRMLPLTETARSTWIRAVYSKRQLAEVLADFWHNHFNVYGWHYYVAPVMVHYDRDVIRANMLGNFRQMLEAVAKSTAMLFYLDNYISQAGGFNRKLGARAFRTAHTWG